MSTPAVVCEFDAVPPVAVLIASGTPAVVNREGGSIVLMDMSRSLSIFFSLIIGSLEVDGKLVRETARTASATASSSRVGSKMMLEPAAITSSVIGGRLLELL